MVSIPSIALLMAFCTATRVRSVSSAKLLTRPLSPFGAVSTPRIAVELPDPRPAYAMPPPDSASRRPRLPPRIQQQAPGLLDGGTSTHHQQGIGQFGHGNGPVGPGAESLIGSHGPAKMLDGEMLVTPGSSGNGQGPLAEPKQVTASDGLMGRSRWGRSRS